MKRLLLILPLIFSGCIKNNFVPAQTRCQILLEKTRDVCVYSIDHNDESCIKYLELLQPCHEELKTKCIAQNTQLE